MISKKVKILKFGKCYLNQKGDFAIALLSGNKERGYQCAVTSSNLFMKKLHLFTRVIPNDNSWKEISIDAFRDISFFHSHRINVVEVSLPQTRTPPHFQYVK